MNTLRRSGALSSFSGNVSDRVRGSLRVKYVGAGLNGKNKFVRSIFYIQSSIASGVGERFTITCSRLAMLLRRLEALLRKGKPRSFDHLFPLRERDCLSSFFSG